jgi:hypothetical protein
MQVAGATVPSRGDHVVQRRTGVVRVGYVWYADQLQVLVKWQDGTSSSLRIGRDGFSIRPAEQEAEARKEETAAPPPLAYATA